MGLCHHMQQLSKSHGAKVALEACPVPLHGTVPVLRRHGISPSCWYLVSFFFDGCQEYLTHWPPSRVSVPNTSLGHQPTYPLSISEGHTQSQNSIAEGRTKWMEMPVLVMEDQGSFWELSSELSILGKFCSLSTVCYNSNNCYHFLYPFICQTLF